MVKPNKNFELDVEDIELIEISIFQHMLATDSYEEAKKFHALLGKLHNQKNWYRPQKNYVGG